MILDRNDLIKMILEACDKTPIAPIDKITALEEVKWNIYIKIGR